MKVTSLSEARFKQLSNHYYQHHFKCRICISAGQGYGVRCNEGNRLWSDYTKLVKAQ